MAHPSISDLFKQPLPYYKWFWQNWRANRKVQRMSWQARGLYRELLDELWVEGVIPDDLGKLAEICGCTLEEMTRHWPEIAPCWVRIEGGYTNAKMEDQRTAKDTERAGNRIGEPYWNRIGDTISNSQSERLSDWENAGEPGTETLARERRLRLSRRGPPPFGPAKGRHRSEI